MKRNIVAFAAVIMAAAVVCAQETTETMALTAARNWAAENADSFAPPGDALAAVPEYDGDTLLWWVVTFSKGGAIVASPDTRIEPIIAVLPSYDGPIPEGHPLRAMLTRDIRNRLKALGADNGASSSAGRRLKSGGGAADMEQSGLPADVAASAAKANAKWADLVPAGPRLKASSKVIHDPNVPDYIIGLCRGFEYGGVYTHWNQSNCPYSAEPEGNCYNYHTPRAMVCGCVATAGAAVMQYFGSTGPIYNATNNCNVGAEGGTGSFSDEFTMIGATNRYDWSILPANLGGTNAVVGVTGNKYMTREQVDLLGRATYDMGVGVSMHWAEDGSGSQVTRLADAFRNYYGFADARAFSFSKGIWSPKIPKSLIYAQVRNNIPVPLGIQQTGATSGHAVIAVGYGQDKAGDPYTRIFMGWAGSHDAWYCLPDISSYDIIDEIVSMVNPDNTKSVPVVGRVVTESGKGAAFVKVALKGDGGAVITNAMTDASGFWAVRIDEEGLALEADQTVVYDVTTTNKCLLGNEKKVKEIKEAMKKYEGSTNEEKSGATVGGVSVDDAYWRKVTVTTNVEPAVTLIDGTTTNYLAIVTNIQVKVRRYAVQADCSDVLAPVDTGVGAYAFQTRGLLTRATAFSVPDEVTLTIPDANAITAFPATEEPENVISNALLSGKMIFMISGDSDTEAYKSIIDYISANAAEFCGRYVLYMIDPDRDAHSLFDGDPSFAIFDPHLFDASDRSAFYNGRLAHFNATNSTEAVSDEIIESAIARSVVAYGKLNSGITLTVDPGIDGIATNGFEVTPEILDWNNRIVSGYGEFTGCFTNDQSVAFIAPSAVTNGNYVLAPNGWVVYKDADIDRINELYEEWEKKYEEWVYIGRYKNFSIYETDEEGNRLYDEYGNPKEISYADYLWNYYYGEPYPSEFPDFDPSGSVYWVTNDSSDPDTFACAALVMEANTVRTLLWRWRVKDVRIAVNVDEGGRVGAAVGGSPLEIVEGGVWVPCSTNENDAVVFTATSYGDGVQFVGWKDLPTGMDATRSEISLIPSDAYSITAKFSEDTTTLRLDYSSSPNVPAKMSVAIGDDDPEEFSEQGTFSWRSSALTLKMPTSVTVDGKTLYCVGWRGTGSVPALGDANVCTLAFTSNSSIVWLWSENENPAEGNQYIHDNVRFAVEAGAGAPEGTFDPAAGAHDNFYTNGETVVCRAAPCVTNLEERFVIACDGWELKDHGGNIISSGAGDTAEITFEANANWTLVWKWRKDALVQIDFSVELNGSATSEDYDDANINVNGNDDRSISMWCLTNSLVDFVVTAAADSSYVFDSLAGDADGCKFLGSSVGEGYTITVPADSDRSLVVMLKKGSDSSGSLNVASVCTNGAEGTSVDWGIVSPQMEGGETMQLGGMMSFTMSGSPYTNIVEGVTNVWVCTGWRLYSGTTNLLAGADSLLASGSGRSASFEFSKASSLIWIWQEATERSPLPDTIEGPFIGGSTPLAVGGKKTAATIANTAKGWWYGLYSSTVLTSDASAWTLVPGKKKLAEADGEVIELEIEWDPAEPQKFFKIIVTENEP